MSELPADPWRNEDPVVDLLAEGELILTALAGTSDDAGRDLLPAISALRADDLRVAVIVAVIERWRQERESPWWRLRRLARRAFGRFATGDD